MKTSISIPGWLRKVIWKDKWLPVMTACWFVFCDVHGFAEERQGKDMAEQPSLELLEFLGGFESADGRWMNPMELEHMDDESLETDHGESNANERKAGETENAS